MWLWWRGLRSLGVEAPADHTDPEALFDVVPQPYRTVLKVMEQDILDRVWSTLTHQHPELELVQGERDHCAIMSRRPP